MFFNCIFSLSHVCFSPHCKAVRLTWFFFIKGYLTWYEERTERGSIWRRVEDQEQIIIIITKIMFMVLSSWQGHCESSPGSFGECRMAPSCRRPKTKRQARRLRLWVRLYTLPETTPTIAIYYYYSARKAKADTHFTVPQRVEGWVDGRPSWLVTYRDGLPVHRRSPILVLTGSDVAELRWSRTTRYH